MIAGLLPLAILLASCGSADPVPDPRIEVLEQRLTEQTRRIDALEATRRQAVMSVGQAPAAGPVAGTSSAFILIGTGSLGEPGREYASQEECETARKGLSDSAARVEREAREHGAEFQPPMGMSCLPAVAKP